MRSLEGNPVFLPPHASKNKERAPVRHFGSLPQPIPQSSTYTHSLPQPPPSEITYYEAIQMASADRALEVEKRRKVVEKLNRELAALELADLYEGIDPVNGVNVA